MPGFRMSRINGPALWRHGAANRLPFPHFMHARVVVALHLPPLFPMSLRRCHIAGAWARASVNSWGVLFVFIIY